MSLYIETLVIAIGFQSILLKQKCLEAEQAYSHVNRNRGVRGLIPPPVCFRNSQLQNDA